METTERRESFRWQIPFSCELDAQESLFSASVVDISTKGVRLALETSRQEPGSPVYLVTNGNGKERFPGQVVYFDRQAPDSSILGVEFAGKSSLIEKVIEILEQKVSLGQLLQENLVGYFDFLLKFHPPLLKFSSQIDLLSVFDELLNDGAPLRPPREFSDELATLTGDDWEIALALVSQWSTSQKVFLSREEAHEMVEGLLWGTVLMKDAEAGLPALGFSRSS